jgi:peptidoglycan-associated lipoprotein
LAAGAFALLAALAASTAFAQTDAAAPRTWWGRPVVDPAPPAESAREILLGTITTGKSAGTERSSVADQLLADGLDALHRGDVMLGRRRLEAVIDAYPDSPAAVTAREELSVLYNIRARTTPGGRATEPTARWVPTQNAPETESDGTDLRNVRSVPPDDRSTLKEARAREHQSRRDARWLRALSFDFQMAAGDRVFFAESSVEIGARSRGVLAAQARWLMRHPGLPVVIEAHADDGRGNRDLDTQISERRARAVQDRLIEEGVESSRITIVAFGRDRPVATCAAPECAAQNRRVITRIGGVPDSDIGRRGIEEPALAVVPPRSPPVRRD